VTSLGYRHLPPALFSPRLWLETHSRPTPQCAQESILGDMQRRLSRAQEASARLRPALTAAFTQLAAIREAQVAARSDAAATAASASVAVADLTAKFTTALVTYGEAHAALMARYRKELTERRRLHNLVQELRGNIRVYCRARPVLPFELEAGGVQCVTFPEVGEVAVTNAKKQTKSWEFDCVFPPVTTNEQVFKETEPLVVSAMDGYNVCVFA